MEKNKAKKVFWIFVVVASFIALFFVGYLRITNLGSEEINIKMFLYTIIFLLFVCVYLYFNNKLKNNCYNSYALHKMSGKIFALSILIYPKKYLKKDYLLKGYFLYLVSRMSLIFSIILLILGPIIKF